jgi:RNA polymerase sigma-70 factor, ECF subfamily
VASSESAVSVSSASGKAGAQFLAVPASVPIPAPATFPVPDPGLLAELWPLSGSASWRLMQSDCDRILIEAGIAANFGLTAGELATPHQQSAFFRALCLPDLVLARACARGHEGAWQRFIALYRQPLTRAAVAITGSDSLGRDLADQLYAELYGLATRDGERRCPLASYRGRGSLIAWLRTTLAQRHIDHHRRTHRESPLDTFDVLAPDPAPQSPVAELSLLARAVESALGPQSGEVRFLLAAYFLDGQTLLQIARVLGVHEATVSRRLQRATGEIRAQILKNLQQFGLSKRAAEEALGADPRDLDISLKKLLQHSQSQTFHEQADS